MPNVWGGGRHQVDYDVRTGHEEECPCRAYSDGWNDVVECVHVRGRDHHVLHGTDFRRLESHVHHGYGYDHHGRRCRRNNLVGTWVVRRTHHYHAYHSHPLAPELSWVSSSPWRVESRGHHSLNTDDHLWGPSHALDTMQVNQYPSDQDGSDGIVFPYDANCWVQDDHRHLEILVDDHIPTTFFSPLLSMANPDEIHP